MCARKFRSMISTVTRRKNPLIETYSFVPNMNDPDSPAPDVDEASISEEERRATPDDIFADPLYDGMAQEIAGPVATKVAGPVSLLPAAYLAAAEAGLITPIRRPAQRRPLDVLAELVRGRSARWRRGRAAPLPAQPVETVPARRKLVGDDNPFPPGSLAHVRLRASRMPRLLPTAMTVYFDNRAAKAQAPAPPTPPPAPEPALTRKPTGLEAVVVPESARKNLPRKDNSEADPGWVAMIGKPYPLISTDRWDARKIGHMRRSLVKRFPHAAAQVDLLFADLLSRSGAVRLRPTILVGAPGSGKTSFALALGRMLGLEPRIVSCGGVHDAMFGGSNRRWGNSEASVPVNLIRSCEVANPMLVLDEIEKVATGRHHGSLLDVILAMIEPSTARRWVDPCAESPVDLSHVIWLATANDVDVLPQPLRDRFRIVAFPMPGAEHLPALAASIIRDQEKRDGLRAGWHGGLTPDELDALVEVWPGGSLRGLGKFVEATIAAREHHARVMPN